jgi:hypothetical protein
LNPKYTLKTIFPLATGGIAIHYALQECSACCRFETGSGEEMMKSAKVLFSWCVAISTISACQNPMSSISVTNSTRVSESLPTAQVLFENFRACIISRAMNSSSEEFSLIKQDYYKKNLEQCRSDDSTNHDLCVRDFKILSADILKYAKAVDCDSGYCTLTY